VKGDVSAPSRVFRIWDRMRQVIGVEVGFGGMEIRHASRDDSGSVSSATEPRSFR
jgi:hypothetical protein